MIGYRVFKFDMTLKVRDQGHVPNVVQVVKISIFSMMFYSQFLEVGVECTDGFQNFGHPTSGGAIFC